jgi:protein SCO1
MTWAMPVSPSQGFCAAMAASMWSCSRHARGSAIRWAVVAVAALVLGACDAGPHLHAPHVAGSPVAQDFHLLDATGQVRSMRDFRGKVVLIFFGYTQCPDICPTALTRAARVMGLLGEDAQRVQVIFVTVDPERDTADVMREYPRAFHPSFLGLYSDLRTTEATAREFRVVYRKVPAGDSYTIDHTAISYAFDPQGRLRLAIPHGQSAQEVADDLRALLHEAG